jgi:hypothetical protein
MYSSSIIAVTSPTMLSLSPPDMYCANNLTALSETGASAPVSEITICVVIKRKEQIIVSHLIHIERTRARASASRKTNASLAIFSTPCLQTTL